MLPVVVTLATLSVCRDSMADGWFPHSPHCYVDGTVNDWILINDADLKMRLNFLTIGECFETINHSS